MRSETQLAEEESVPADLKPDFLFRCALPQGLKMEDLRVRSLSRSSADIQHLGDSGTLFQPDESARAAGATLALSTKPRRNRIEIRSLDRCWSSGALNLRLLRNKDEVLPLELRPVGRVALRFEDTDGEPVDVALHADAFEFDVEYEKQPLLLQDGSQFQIGYRSVIEDGPDSSTLRIERIRSGSISFSVLRAGYEIHNGDLLVELGQALRHTVVLRPLPTAGELSGRVMARSGQAPLQRGTTGVVRVVDADNRKLQFNVPLKWENGMAQWSTGSLPFGEYRVWVEDVGKLFVTPTDTRVLSPPQAGIDWVLHDDKPLRSIGVDVRDASTGEPILELYCRVRVSSDRSHFDRIHETQLLSSGIPEDSPRLWEISSPGFSTVTLRVSDFSERRIVTSDQVSHLKEPTEVWFAQIELQR